MQGSIAHFSNTQAFEKWSRAIIALFALRAEKVRGDAEIDKAPGERPSQEGSGRYPIEAGKATRRGGAQQGLFQHPAKGVGSLFKAKGRLTDRLESVK